MLVELPTSDGNLWVNPDHVVGLRHAEEGATFLYAVTTQYTVQLPVTEVAALLAGQQPARVVTP